jgi:hypothetical protein
MARGLLQQKLLRYFEWAKVLLPIDLAIYKVPGLVIYSTDKDWVFPLERNGPGREGVREGGRKEGRAGATGAAAAAIICDQKHASVCKLTGTRGALACGRCGRFASAKRRWTHNCGRQLWKSNS